MGATVREANQQFPLFVCVCVCGGDHLGRFEDLLLQSGRSQDKQKNYQGVKHILQ